MLKDLISCSKCDGYHNINNFRVRKNNSGNYYRLKICIFCEREIKKIAEKKRYNNFTAEQKLNHFNRAKKCSQTTSYKNWRNNWQKTKEKNDINFKLKRRISALLRYHIKKKQSAFKLLNYSVLDLKNHLEQRFELWMSWDNWGVYDSKNWDDNDTSTWTWQIDHIMPVSKFNIQSVNDDEFKKCWSLENLRPISSKENILKGSKLL